jgi:creatinine amidohydrolase/Fe(II)-dependent formamide hydrolase-like protein
MARMPSRRLLGELSSPEVARSLTARSILCLPLGAIEQHGPHLPLNTDVIVAEGLTQAIVARWGETFDLWQLPTFSFGLSREHDWAPGTMSLSIGTFVAMLRELAGEIARALPARNLAFINGHGGNRGVLDTLMHELRGDFSLNCCALHPFDLAKPPASLYADVHGAKNETSVMLVLAPELVRRELIARSSDAADQELLYELVFDRGASWPWRTDDARLARSGIIGDAHAATAELGRSIIAGVVGAAQDVFARLLDNQQVMNAAPPAPPRRRRASPGRTSSRSGNRRRPRPQKKS